MRTATSPTASRGKAIEIARSAASRGAARVAALSSRTVPSPSRCSPSTDAVAPPQLTDRRREPPLGHREPEAAEHHARRGQRVRDAADRERVRPPARQRGKRPPGGCEPEVGVEAPAEQLQVVGEDRKPAADHEGNQRRGDRDDPGDPDRQRPGEADGSQGDQRPVGEPGSERTPGELVERMSAHSDREKERRKRGDEAVGVDLRRGRRPEGDVAQMPDGVRGVEERREVPPAAGRERVEGGAISRHRGFPRRRRPRRGSSAAR